MNRRGVIAIFWGILALAVTAVPAIGASSNAEKCQAAKNKKAGDYYSCREKAEAAGILEWVETVYSKCSTKFDAAWDKAEAKGAGECPDNVPTAEMNAYIARQAAETAAIIAGTQDVPTCGDNVINAAGEQCDGTDLGGTSCGSLGLAGGGGTLACTASCKLDACGCDGTDCNECSPNPCQNGGSCNDGSNSFTCTCAPGWTGATCATNVDDCAPNPCQNGGSCSDGLNSFTCTCVPGWTGATCATNVDDCAPNPCQNGGTCNDGVNSFWCTCLPEWHGPTCETCGYSCASDPDYYRDRYLICAGASGGYVGFECQGGPNSSCESYCSSWMGCEGPLAINQDGWGTVTGPDATCF